MRRAADTTVGQTIGPRRVPVDRELLRAYAAASGDDNPIHLDEAVARSVGLPDVIAHGMWTMGAAAGLVADWAGDPGRVVSYGTRFTKPVVVPADSGAELEVSGTVTRLDAETGEATVELTVTAAGTRVLGRTRVGVRLD